MASISRVINVALLPQGRTAATINMNAVCVVTSEQGVLTSAERYRAYASSSEVETDWGSASDVAAYARTVFGSKVNPTKVGGAFIVGFYRAATETVAAASAVLRGAQLVEATVVDALQLIDDGSFTVSVDGGAVALTGLDFTSVGSLADVVTVLDAAITASGATVTLSNSRIVITSDTTGATSTITLATNGATGTPVATLLGLIDGSGAVATQGAASTTLDPETKVAALSAIKAQVQFRGVCFIDQILDAEVPALREWTQAESVLMYSVWSGSDYFAKSVADNPVWATTIGGFDTFRMLYSQAGDRRLAAAYMARAHTVNFNAQNSALTMNLKELNAVPEDYTETELNQAKAVGLDVYTLIKDTPNVLTSNKNSPIDDVYNLISYVDACEVGAFNFLRGTSTKVPQTTPGMNALVDSLEKVSTQYVRAAFIAPGTWLSPDSFGDQQTFLRNIEQNGYYWLAGPISEQSQADRDARKSTVIQHAIKFAGAIESVDVVINFNR